MKEPKLHIEHEDGTFTDKPLPSKTEVCPRCDGKGRHSNPAIDGNGITEREMEELGDEFRDDYFSGRLDITCQECNGEKVIAVVDELALQRRSPEDLKLWHEQLSEEWEMQQLEESERAYGC